jgi:hypothetical protein
MIPPGGKNWQLIYPNCHQFKCRTCLGSLYPICCQNDQATKTSSYNVDVAFSLITLKTSIIYFKFSNSWMAGCNKDKLENITN